MQLAPGEKIILQTHPTWRAAIAFYLKSILIVLIIAAIAAGVTRIASDSVQWAWVIVIALLIFAGVLIAGYLIRRTTTYTVTNERLYIRWGIFTRNEKETRLTRVQNVSIRQPLIKRMLVIGDVDFDTAGGDDYEFSFRGVASPQKIVHAVHQAQRVEPGQTENSSGL